MSIIAHSNSFHRQPGPAVFQKDLRLQSWLDRKTHWMLEHEFEGDAGDSLPMWLGTQDTSAAGSPTLDYVADTAGGVFRLKHDNTSEAQTLTLYGADNLLLNPAKNPFMVARVLLNTEGAAFSADQRIVIGLASARNATLDSVATNAWFRVEGANFDILTESDDGTTDDDDNDSTLDWSDNAYAWFRVSVFYTEKKVLFEVDLEDGDGWRVAGAPLAVAAISSSMLLQPFIEIQRDASTEQEDVLIDYLAIGAKR